VVGIGIDLVDVERLRVALERTPRMALRVFTDAERAAAEGPRAAARLATRFAAKEATLKALGRGIFEVALSEIEVTGGGDGPPALCVRGRAAELAGELGITRWLVSLTHEADVAAAIVVAVA
jgi:holo-[acyl-carrier protein] synthase